MVFEDYTYLWACPIPLSHWATTASEELLTLSPKTSHCVLVARVFLYTPVAQPHFRIRAVRAPSLRWSWGQRVSERHLGDRNWNSLNIYLITRLHKTKLFFFFQIINLKLDNVHLYFHDFSFTSLNIYFTSQLNETKCSVQIINIRLDSVHLYCHDFSFRTSGSCRKHLTTHHLSVKRWQASQHAPV